MAKFAAIRKRAARRQGGETPLGALMPAILSPAELAAIPDDRWLAQMTKQVFRAGFSWRVIDDKWDGFEAAFEGFNPGRLSVLSDDDIDGLMVDTRIVRNGQKIAAVRPNATFLVDLAREHGSAAALFAEWPAEDFIGLLDLLKTRGARLGGNSGQMFLRFMGKDSFILSKDVAAALIANGIVTKNPTSKSDLAATQDAFNQWRAESGLPLAHISRILACSVGD